MQSNYFPHTKLGLYLLWEATVSVGLGWELPGQAVPPTHSDLFFANPIPWLLWCINVLCPYLLWEATVSVGLGWELPGRVPAVAGLALSGRIKLSPITQYTLVLCPQKLKSISLLTRAITYVSVTSQVLRWKQYVNRGSYMGTHVLMKKLNNIRER